MLVLDIFSGVGGFSVGFEKTGKFDTGAFCEIDANARMVLRKNWKETKIFEDISELHCRQGEFDVIAGGFPCQDISIAGRQVGIHGSRSGLWGQYARLIGEVRPKFAVIENVSNLRSKGLSRVMRDLASLGYDAEFHLIPASAIGALHRRERMWIVAYPSGSSDRGLVVTAERLAEFSKKTTSWDRLRKGVVPPTLPGKYSRDKKREARIKQMGNAIVPQLAEMIAGCIVKGFSDAPPRRIGKEVDVSSWEDMEKLKGRSGILRSGKFAELSPISPFDEEQDCGLFPTPTCRDALVKAARPPERMVRADGRNVLRQPGLAEMMMQPKGFPILKQELDGKVLTQEEIEKVARFSHMKNDICGQFDPGMLNPEWVEMLMGFAPGWTEV